MIYIVVWLLAVMASSLLATLLLGIKVRQSRRLFEVSVCLAICMFVMTSTFLTAEPLLLAPLNTILSLLITTYFLGGKGSKVGPLRFFRAFVWLAALMLFGTFAAAGTIVSIIFAVRGII